MSNFGDTQEIVRGGVYWVDLENTPTYIDAFGERRNTHLMLKRRPYVVVSNDVCNKVSPVVSVVPCTTQADSSITAVRIMLQNKETFIQCEQILSIDAKRLSYKSFAGVLSPKIMQEVDTKLKLQLALEYKETDIVSILLNMERVLLDLEESKRQEVRKEMENDKVLKDTMDSIKSISSKLGKYAGMTATEKFNARYNLNDESQSHTVTEPVKPNPAKVKFSDEQKLAFVKEYLALKKAKVGKDKMLSFAHKLGYDEVVVMQTAISHFRTYLKKKGVDC